jgi:phospholipid-translocating ATPase
MSVLVKS